MRSHLNPRTFDIDCLRKVLHHFPTAQVKQKVWCLLTQKSRASSTATNI